MLKKLSLLNSLKFIEPFVKKSLNKGETPHSAPEAAGETRVDKTAMCCPQTPEMEELRARIEQQDQKIDELESRTTADLLAADMGKAKGWAESQYNGAMNYLTGLKDQAMAGASDAYDYIAGKGQEAVDAAQRQLDAAKAEAIAELNALEKEYQTQVARVEKAVSQGWADALETGAATLAEVENFGKLGKEKMLQIVEDVQDLPDQAWQAVEQAGNWSAKEVKVVLAKMEEAGHDVSKFVGKNLAALKDFSQEEFARVVETVKDNKKVVAALVAEIALFAVPKKLIVLGAAIATGVVVTGAVGLMAREAYQWATPQFEEFVKLCSKKAEYVTELLNSQVEWSKEQLSIMVDAVEKAGGDMVALAKEMGPLLVNKTTEEVKEMAALLGKNVEAGVAFVTSLANESWAQANVAVEALLAQGADAVALVEALGDQLAKATAKEVQELLTKLGDAKEAVVKVLELVADQAWEVVVTVVDTALGLGVEGLQIVEALGNRVKTFAAEELKEFLDKLGDAKDAVVKVLELVADQGWEVVVTVLDTAIGLGVEGSRLVEAMGEQIYNWAAEKFSMLVEELSKDASALLALGEGIVKMGAEQALVWFKKAQEMGVQLDKAAREYAQKGADAVVKLMELAHHELWEVPVAMAKEFAAAVANWTLAELNQLEQAVTQGLVQLEGDARVIAREAHRRQRALQREGRVARTGSMPDGAQSRIARSDTTGATEL